MGDSVLSATEYFLSQEGEKDRYLFGCNDHSADLASKINPTGFIDDYKSGTTFCGKPVLGGEAVPQSAIVVNCVLMAKSWAAKRRVDQLNVRFRLDYYDLLKTAPNLTPVPKFVSETICDMRNNKNHWENLSQTLADNESRMTLSNVINFRKTADLRYLQNYSFRPVEQYFDPVCPLIDQEAFVDCGGFDGDTTEEFIRRCPKYEQVWMFEPSKENLEKAKSRLKGVRDIHFISKGVSDREGVLGFNSGKGSASALSETGNTSIAVTTIDKEIQEPVSFIKMDLEGWEMKALSGARRHINSDHPKMAIAVYHHPSDFWRIPEFIFSIRKDYKIYLRHYTEGWTETVMYFIPIK